MCCFPCTYDIGPQSQLWELASQESEKVEPPPYTCLPVPGTLYRSDIMTTIENAVALYDKELRELSLKLHGAHTSGSFLIDIVLTSGSDHPELGFKELCAFLSVLFDPFKIR